MIGIAASKKRKSQFLSLEKNGDHVDFIKAVTIEVYMYIEELKLCPLSSSPLLPPSVE